MYNLDRMVCILKYHLSQILLMLGKFSNPLLQQHMLF